MKLFLLCAILIVFTFGECWAVNSKQPPSPALEKIKSKPHPPLKNKKKKISRQEIDRLRKKTEKEGKRQRIEAQLREYRQMQEAREQGITRSTLIYSNTN